MDKVKMINAVTGSEMWVSKDRVFEYRRAGHKQAGKLFGSVATSQLIPTKVIEPKEAPAEEKKPEPVKKTQKTAKSPMKQKGKR